MAGLARHQRHQQTHRVTEVLPSLSERQRVRKRWYLTLMSICLALILLAWNVVRFWSTDAAIAMSVIAAILPPIAAIVGNWHTRI